MSITLNDLTRKPEFMEKILLYCERKKIFKCISISVKVSKVLNDDVVYCSLRALVLKYPLLFSVPVGDEPHVRYEPLEKILFKDVYSINSQVTESLKDESVRNILSSVSFHENLTSKTALWKIVYYKNTGWLTFYSSHSFTDGGSIVAYLKDFVEGLNHAGGSEAKEVLFSLDEDLKILKHGISPGLFDCVNYRPDFLTRAASTVLKSVISWWPGIVPSVLEKQRHNSFFVECSPVPFEKETCFESDYLISGESPLNTTMPFFITFDVPTLNAILQACREQQVKLSSFLILVYACTINQLYPGVYEDKFLKVGVAVSFRNLFKNLQSHGTYLGDGGRFDDGFYTYGVTYFLEPHLGFSWQNVRKYHQFLHDTVCSEDWKNEYYIGCQTMEAGDYMNARYKKKGDCCFITNTNLGHIEVLDHGSSDLYQIEDILFAPSAGATMGTHHITVCSTSKSGVNIGFSDGDERIDDWPNFKKTLSENILKFSGVDASDFTPRP